MDFKKYTHNNFGFCEKKILIQQLRGLIEVSIEPYERLD